MKYWYLLVFVVVSLGCTSKKNSIYIETIPNDLINDENRFDLDNKVYPVNKEVLYQVTIEHNSKTLDIELKYLRMTIQGTTKPFSNFDSDYSQTVIQFEYLNQNKKRITLERTGLVENKINIWLHPPRSDDLGILQLSAFPYIKLNAVKNWKWELDAAYANYQNMHLTHYYKKQKERIYELNVGKLQCVLVEAITKSRIGETKAEFLYHHELGFVSMKFYTLEDTLIILDMVK